MQPVMLILSGIGDASLRGTCAETEAATNDIRNHHTPNGGCLRGTCAKTEDATFESLTMNAVYGLVDPKESSPAVPLETKGYNHNHNS